MSASWRPTASLDLLRQRASLLNCIRAFFAQRQVLEVETPLLSQATVTDLHLDSMVVELHDSKRRFLQTSPEFAMKRLLAAGSGPIYQICKAFRRDEAGQRHNPEFTMLEWYRPGFDDQLLMAEIEALVCTCAEQSDNGSSDWAVSGFERISYRDLFLSRLDIDPFAASDQQLIDLARQQTASDHLTLSRDDALNLLMAVVIEPALQAPVFVTDFPASQASLAATELTDDGHRVARRFELFIRGMEIANGYLELTDAQEQARRFAADNQRREQVGLPVQPVDEFLLAALASGLPDCAGVALGFDRLLMLISDRQRIAEVISFDDNNA
ncbi:EF-P lysine aminoacylase EpmA [Pseudohongiella sp. O18]|uniref:EF-P lysine aminoacylase EpmA n=1 Tax=Pseudohongiella sp. O18 TaxID=2904248 RepID=UPI001EEF64DB|nr:EF-P lysine aminoacylase EpmA [Pseudohongiella sp. O18]